MSSSSENRLPSLPKRILVVEGEWLVAETIQKILAVDGHRANIAPTGEEALTMLSGGEYDVVITEFQLGGMDGLELAEAVKKHAPATPIILMTGNAERVRGMGEISNIERVLGKPVSIKELNAAVREVTSL